MSQKSQMSQKVTLSKHDRIHIEKIKQLILDNKSQVEMSVSLGLRRETVNRKIQRWIQTSDFESWIKEAWLNKLQKVDDVEAFKALTKLYVAYLHKKGDVELDAPITIKWPDWMKHVSSNTGSNTEVRSS